MRMLRYAARYTVYANMVTVYANMVTVVHAHTLRDSQVLTSLACNVICQKVKDSLYANTAASIQTVMGLPQKPAVRLPVSTVFSSLLCLPCPSQDKAASHIKHILSSASALSV